MQITLDLTQEEEPPGQPSPVSCLRRRHYPSVPDHLWADWKWQIRNRITTAAALETLLPLSLCERDAIERHRGPLPVAITPYYLGLIDPDNLDDPLRRTVVPRAEEYLRSPGEELDPLGEDADSPAPGVVHRYPDRVLFLATDFCSTNCRYCTRSRLITTEDRHSFTPAQWEQGIAYVRSMPRVRDVLISGR